MVAVRNKFNTLQEISRRHTPNDDYENFVTDNMETTAECITTKPRTKCRVLSESPVVRKKMT